MFAVNVPIQETLYLNYQVDTQNRIALMLIQYS